MTLVPDGDDRSGRCGGGGRESGLVKAVKLYPAGATTNSDSAGSAISARSSGVLERMAEIGLPLCVHGEVTDPEIDIFDREAVFIDRVLDPVRRLVPGLRVVMEHVTTSDAVAYVSSVASDLAATVTPHHLILNRNDLLVGGIRPHYYCLPIVKRDSHRLALRKAATSGDARFFLGTDSAPHADHTKEAPCGCAGVFNAPNTLSCLAHVFEEEDALDQAGSVHLVERPGLLQIAGRMTETHNAGREKTTPSSIRKRSRRERRTGHGLRSGFFVVLAGRVKLL